jgi:hypothetical protein
VHEGKPVFEKDYPDSDADSGGKLKMLYQLLCQQGFCSFKTVFPFRQAQNNAAFIYWQHWWSRQWEYFSPGSATKATTITKQQSQLNTAQSEAHHLVGWWK